MKYVLFYIFFLLLPVAAFCRQLPRDTVVPAPADSIPIPQPRSLTAAYDSSIYGLLRENSTLNSSGPAFAVTVRPKPDAGKEYLFYLLAGVFLFLALLRFFYARYFFNLFRVFFNTSLRQGQLTDQLLQAKLPSLMFNLFFIVSGGLFLYLVLDRFGWLGNRFAWWVGIPASVCLVGVLYGIKYCTLKFTGWITSFKEPADTYIFIVFLINKIIGILLLPATVLLAFAAPALSLVAAQAALVMTGLMLVLRFFRSYGLLQGRLKVSRMHFLLYVLGVEVLPLLLIYKGLVIYLDKNN